jgi:hypothetical protein
MRRVVLIAAILLVALLPTRALAGSGSDSSDDGSSAAPTTTIDNSFLDTKRDLGDCLNNSIGLPDCGHEPTSAGDRGGALQYVTFVVMILGIAFISWRVVRAIRARDAALGSR